MRRPLLRPVASIGPKQGRMGLLLLAAATSFLMLSFVWLSSLGELHGASASFVGTTTTITTTTATTRTTTRTTRHRYNAPHQPNLPKVHPSPGLLQDDHPKSSWSLAAKINKDDEDDNEDPKTNKNNSNKNMNSWSDQDQMLEDSRVRIWTSRRQSIRSTLKLAEQVRNIRWAQNWIPDMDPTTGKPTKSDGGKAAVTLTAFGVAAGAVALRLGGRAALVSAIGLDFAKDNPELKDQLDQVIQYANDMNLGTEVLVFVAAWTAVKVFCFDAGGIVLALASGILFGGVWQGALASATAATIGSSVCFLLAKLDTPVRNKALQIVDDYPSLRGIERVVAQDGFKAILTLRLAPILPIPLGLYNYVYGVTNVPFADFASGIFLGSFKPYLLDSYLGYFGKSVMDGSVGDAMGVQDLILLLALGLSVLIGVFASQLAGETWDVVLQEVEAERKAKLLSTQQQGGEENDNFNAMLEGLVTTQVAGVPLPEWMIDWQIDWGMAEERMKELVQVESQAKVWNYTDPNCIPFAINPAIQSNAPEVTQIGDGVDLQKSVLDGLVLSPVLFATFMKFADPFYQDSCENDNDNEDDDTVKEPTTTTMSFAELSKKRKRRQREEGTIIRSANVDPSEWTTGASVMEWEEVRRGSPSSTPPLDTVDTYVSQLEVLRSRSQQRLERLESLLQQQDKDSNGR